MQQIWFFFISLLVSFGVGSIPTSVLIGKIFFKKDVRNFGSGNAGATNVFRIFGWKAALFVGLFDVFKGWFVTEIYSQFSYSPHPVENFLFYQILLGSAAILGHNYTIFSGFRGGKGVATLAGVMIALFPLIVPLCLLVFVLTIILTGYVSLASLFASVCFPVFSYFLPLLFRNLNATPSVLLGFSIVAPLWIIYSHRQNIKRLLKGSENRFEKAMVFKRIKFF